MRKNRNLALIVVISIIALTTLACSFGGINVSVNARTVRGSGDITTEIRAIKGVSGVQLASIGDLTIRYGDEEKLEIEAEDNLLEYITTDVHGGVLTIGTENNINFQPREAIRYTLTITEALEEISVSGLGSIDAPELDTNRLKIRVSGAGDIDIDGVNGSKVDVIISGLGSVYIRDGAVDEMEVGISGSGSFKAKDVRAQYGDIHISGLGNAEVWVEEELEERSSGPGNIEYYGSPKINQDVSGIGSIKSNDR